MKLTSRQIEALQLVKELAISGTTFQYETKFSDGRTNYTRQIKALKNAGLVDVMYFTGGRSAVNLTEKGREIA